MNAFKVAISGFALLTSLLVACRTGPTQSSSGDMPSKAFQTQQANVPPFATVSPEEYRAARESACRRFCSRYYRYSTRWQYARVSCIRDCLSGEPTDMFPSQ
ncbi:hypothetical protein D3C72_1843330 [compost metagenome]